MEFVLPLLLPDQEANGVFLGKLPKLKLYFTVAAYWLSIYGDSKHAKLCFVDC